MKEFPFVITYQGKGEVPVAQNDRRVCYFYQVSAKQIKKKGIHHHILVVDVSQSMASYMLQLKQNLNEILIALCRGRKHYVSVIIYSGHQEARCIIQAVKCDRLTYDMAQVFDVIEKELYPRSHSLLSEALALGVELSQRVEEICEKQHITLFTNGLLSPQEWTIQEEEERCIQFATYCSEHPVNLHCVGYGPYYDALVLKKMLGYEHVEELIHIDQLQEYGEKVKELIKRMDEQSSYELPIMNQQFFYCGNHMSYKETKLLSGVKYNQEECLVVYDEPLQIKGKKVKLNQTKITQEEVVSFLYHLSAYYLLHEDIESAKTMIASTGDVGAYEKVCCGYLPCEKRQIIKALIELARSPQKRYQKGKEQIEGEKEKEEPLCLLEILNLLLEDPESKLLWDYHYPYERIGLCYTMEQTPYRFIRPTMGYGEVEELQIGSQKLNIGLNVKIKGQVEEVKTHLKMDAVIYRNYNLIVNGNLNMDTIVCKLSKDLKARFKKEKLLKQTFKEQGEERCVLHLHKLNVTNKRVLKQLKIEELAQCLYDLEVLKVKQWVIKKLIEEISVGDNSKSLALGLTKSQVKLRSRFQIDEKGVYQPKERNIHESQHIHFYKAHVMEWKIEKFPKKKYQEQIRAMYEEALEVTTKDRLAQLQEELWCVKQEKKEKNKKVQYVRLAAGLMKQNIMNWDETYMKEKKQTQTLINDNSVVGGQMVVSTKKIGEVILKEEQYTLLVPCHEL